MVEPGREPLGDAGDRRLARGSLTLDEVIISGLIRGFFSSLDGFTVAVPGDVNVAVPNNWRQAALPPGTCLIGVTKHGEPRPLRWPGITHGPISFPGLLRAVVIRLSVECKGVWLTATAPRTRGGSWRLWQLQEWAGGGPNMGCWPTTHPTLPWDDFHGATVHTDAGVTPGYFALPSSRIHRVRARIISGDPWEAWHPVTEVDPADPWGDVCARWRQLCLLMGYAPEDLHPHRTLRPEELFFADPWQGEQSISGWNWWTACGGWEGSENCTKQCLSEISTTPQRYPTNAAWVLSRTGTIYPVPAGSYISDPSPAMRLATDPTVLTAASLYLSVRSCSGIDFISSACGPDTYRTQWRTVSKADEKLLDPPASMDPALYPYTRRHPLYGWKNRYFAHDTPPISEINTSDATAVSACATARPPRETGTEDTPLSPPWTGSTGETPLQPGQNLSDLTSNPEVFRTLLADLTH